MCYDTTANLGAAAHNLGAATQYAHDETVGLGESKSYRPSLAEELEKSQYDATVQSERRAKALVFLKANPAFDEFVTLIRTGCLNI